MDSLLHSPSLLLALLVACLYITIGGIYRLYYSPIAQYPGPWLAALTFWYEFYYDVVCKGRYSWKIQELHQKYGPVVRINPKELHVADPAFYDSVYVGPGRRTEKWEYSARMFGTTSAAVGTIGHELHRVRRGALNGFFSKRAVANPATSIQQVVDHGCKLLRSRGVDDRVLNLRSFFAAFSADVIGLVAFGSNYKLLEREDFEPGWQKLMMDLSRGTHLMKQLPWAYPLLKVIPQLVVSLLHPPGTRLFKIRNDINLKIEQTRRSLSSNKADEEHGIPSNNPKPTALHALLTSPLPAPELQTPRLEDEAFTLLGAGTITTAHTLTTTLYHVLANPSIQSALEKELDDMYFSLPEENPIPSLTDFEHLPYLQATIAEGLRLSFGVSHRLPRISPDTALHYSGTSSHDGKKYVYTIPPGVPISMTPMFMHLDPDVFPSPHTFEPRRWIPSNDTEDETGALKRRRAYLVPFSKGTRSCAGMWLAYAELYLMIGALFAPDGVGRRMELFETSVEDVECVHDFFNPSPRLDSKGVRVVLKEALLS
ncbi:putative P450 monooxygenase [Bimuria novae-zelandiae CBS 107.79]|uniref:Putative P450 monooxygenase n=1 Tax=Bimuria novae-zelandiae CBS 107.79 TaxID=1447943 RepID=A0A6A5VM93_9PLEO|nr:putative P450 monooxygenase [Bimuria novae-zelandiae CBS 107.79]